MASLTGHRSQRAGRVLVRTIALLATIAFVAWSAPSFAGPLKTWGDDTPDPAPTETSPPSVPPPPPPPSSATSDSADTSNGEEASESAPSIVRAPGKVGLRYTLEGIEVRGNTSTLARVVLRFVPFRAGDSLDVDDKELLLTRFRLLGTGYFRDVQLSLRRGTKRGYVVLVVNVVERNTIVVNDLWLGLSADAEPDGKARPLTAYGGLDVSELNLAGTGVALGGAIALADGQLALRSRISDPQFLKSSWSAEAQLLYNNAKDFFGNRDVLVDDPTQTTSQDFAVVSYRRFGGLVGAGHEVGSVATRVFFDYRLEKIDATIPLAASHKRGLDVEPIDFYLIPGSSVLSTISATLVHDTRDEPFLPKRGWYLLGLAEASLTPLGSNYPYTKLVLRGSRWIPLPWDHVLRIEGIFGSVFGQAPLFEKFYVGDYTDLRPHRALDLAFDRRAAPNFFDTSIVEVRYGDYAARLNTEYRIPLYRGRKSIYGVDLFGSVGVYSVANARDFTQPARGYAGLSKLPIDLTFNFGMRADTAVGGFAIGLSNLIGFIPIRSEGQ
ncbi:BamA/TamA family outer membrane protein [Labilithrix luteola]|uniref:BamA/TamA family outer membrane protein n=1 Tax=Labilithrix luteola TaxID=1391654 RepID=UPI001474A20B|nr:BamA/TamA family outer membrane protein [Labilithrix luteola]